MSRMSISIIGHVILTHQPASGSALNNTSFPPTVKVTANLSFPNSIIKLRCQLHKTHRNIATPLVCLLLL